MIDYHYAKPENFMYIVKGNNMYIKQVSNSNNISFFIDCVINGVEEDVNNKFILKLFDFDDQFVYFLKKLENHIKTHKLFSGSSFISSLKMSHKRFLETKVKYRYSKFEVKVYNDTILYPITEIKEPIKARICLELNNVWKMNNYSGILFIVKQIKINTHK